MAQNTSAAVMARRTNKRPPHPLEAEFAAAGLDRYLLDDFPTPPWGGRAWCEHVVGPAALKNALVWEPTVNRGFLARGLGDYCGELVTSDIFGYVPDCRIFNFLDLVPGSMLAAPAFLPRRPEWVVTNPPFVRAELFIEAAFDVATVGIAMLCRMQITETVGRYKGIFERYAGRWAWSQFAERLPMWEAKCERRMNSASAYGWLTIWQQPPAAEFILARRHIPPTRAALERPGDYDAAVTVI